MVRLITLVLISIIPVERVRLMLYRKIFGFKLGRNVKISMFNLLDIQDLTMEDNARIRGCGNIFFHVRSVEMGEFSRIGGPSIGLNLFRGTSNKKGYPKSVLKLGHCTIIELFNYFDLCADIILGDNVVIGGIRSTFFTHSFMKSSFEPITVGDNCFIATNCIFQMGTTIAPNSVVGMGSVVTKKFDKENCLIAGVPADIVKESYECCIEDAFRLRKLPYFKEGKVQPLK